MISVNKKVFGRIFGPLFVLIAIVSAAKKNNAMSSDSYSGGRNEGKYFSVREEFQVYT